MIATISAQLVADGVGLPPYSKSDTCQFGPWISARGDAAFDGDAVYYRLWLNDHQTRAGLLRQLAMWAGDDGEAQAYWLDVGDDGRIVSGWELRSFQLSPARYYCTVWRDRTFQPVTVPANPTEALAIILETIGLDHRIRRALGWEVAAGTLATLTSMHDGHQWTFTDGVNRHGFFAKGRCSTADYTIVPGVLYAEPLEARRAIAAEVCP